jgi:mannose-6-phosphate isomerase-like protein (cupin superfamily)
MRPFALVEKEHLHASVSKVVAAAFVRGALLRSGFGHVPSDMKKPWGVEFQVPPDRLSAFVARFFADGGPDEIVREAFGPKLMVIQEAHRLSWHVHARKDALLRVLHGHVGVSVSATDDEPAEPAVALPGELVRVPPGMRHRLASRSGWAVIAEISRNVDPSHPTDDDDTRRIRDDYGRDG